MAVSSHSLHLSPPITFWRPNRLTGPDYQQPWNSAGCPSPADKSLRPLGERHEDIAENLGDLFLNLRVALNPHHPAMLGAFQPLDETILQGVGAGQQSGRLLGLPQSLMMEAVHLEESAHAQDGGQLAPRRQVDGVLRGSPAAIVALPSVARDILGGGCHRRPRSGDACPGRWPVPACPTLIHGEATPAQGYRTRGPPQPGHEDLGRHRRHGDRRRAPPREATRPLLLGGFQAGRRGPSGLPPWSGRAHLRPEHTFGRFARQLR